MRVLRYLVFAGNYYYPSGGMNDVIGSVSSLDHIPELLEGRDLDWTNVLDLVTGEQVFEHPSIGRLR